jgi:hypothetical protein
MKPAVLIQPSTALQFRATGRDRSGSVLGMLVDAAGVQQHLLVAEDGRSSLSPTLPPGKEPVFLYESTANVLRGGTPNADGSISYHGDSYRIEASLDGGRRTARVRGG